MPIYRNMDEFMVVRIEDRDGVKTRVYPDSISAKVSENGSTEVTLIFTNPIGLQSTAILFNEGVELTNDTAALNNYIFKGFVLDPSTGKQSTFVCYDLLNRILNEHVPINEGVYIGTDAGAIIRDIISNSDYTIDISRVAISTGVIIDEVDFTDMNRLDAIKLLISAVNGSLEDETGDLYHIYSKNDGIIFETLPTYENSEPVLELTQSDIIGEPKIEKGGTDYYNCCTVVGDGIRASYPGQVAASGDIIPDFPDNPRHKLIKNNAIKGLDICYAIARNFVRTHNVLPETISVTINPERFDLFQNQECDLDFPSYGVIGRHKIKDVGWNVGPGKLKRMTLKFSSIKIQRLTRYIKS